MALIVELTLHGPALFGPTFEQVPEAECRIENVYCMTDSEGYSHYVAFCWTRGCDLAEFENALSLDPSVSEFRIVTELGARRLYHIATERLPPEQPLVYEFFRENDTVEREAKLTADGLELEARFPTREVLREFLNTADDIAESTTVTRIYTEESTEGLNRQLTQKQRDALTLALDSGYFETPSQITLAEIAEECAVTPQTLSRHVRVGVKKLLESTIEPGEHSSGQQRK